MVYKYVVDIIVNTLFPAHCLISDQIIEKSSQSRFISHNAAGLLPRLNTTCLRCGIPLTSPADQQCGQCLKQPPQFDRVISPLAYAEPIKQLIHELKFKQKLYYAGFFAEQIGNKVQQEYQSPPQLLIPLPLHSKRLNQRGYNQAREISRLLSKQLNIVHDDQSVIRIKATDEQSALNAKQRRQNVKNAFAVKTPLEHIQHIAVIDDVMTTGATANSIADTLKQAGVGQVDIWVAARTTK